MLDPNTAIQSRLTDFEKHVALLLESVAKEHAGDAAGISAHLIPDPSAYEVSDPHLVRFCVGGGQRASFSLALYCSAFPPSINVGLLAPTLKGPLLFRYIEHPQRDWDELRSVLADWFGGVLRVRVLRTLIGLRQVVLTRGDQTIARRLVCLVPRRKDLEV